MYDLPYVIMPSIYFFSPSGNAHTLKPFNDNFGIVNNNKWTLALSIFYVGYCQYSITSLSISVPNVYL